MSSELCPAEPSWGQHTRGWPGGEPQDGLEEGRKPVKNLLTVPTGEESLTSIIDNGTHGTKRMKTEEALLPRVNRRTKETKELKRVRTSEQGLKQNDDIFKSAKITSSRFAEEVGEEIPDFLLLSGAWGTWRSRRQSCGLEESWVLEM